jgi:hypothetical protein
MRRSRDRECPSILKFQSAEVRHTGTGNNLIHKAAGTDFPSALNLIHPHDRSRIRSRATGRKLR